MGQILIDRYGFKVNIIKDSTREDIIDELEALKKELTRKDSLLIYYAGHGIIREDGGYWIGVDAGKTRRRIWLNYTTINDLIDTAAGMTALHVLVIADSCYSGAALRNTNAAIKKRTDEVRSDWLHRMNRAQSRTILTSGGTEPVLDKVGSNRNSIFAYEVLAKLLNNSDVLEGQALHGLIKEEVHSRAKRAMGLEAQSPEYGHIPGTGHSGGDFLFRPIKMMISTTERRSKKAHTFGIRGQKVEDHEARDTDQMHKHGFYAVTKISRGLKIDLDFLQRFVAENTDGIDVSVDFVTHLLGLCASGDVQLGERLTWALVGLCGRK